MKKISVFLVLTILACTLAGCGQNENQESVPDKKMNLNIVLEEADTEGRPLEEAIQAYQEQHPEINIQIETIVNSYPKPGTSEEEAKKLAEKRASQVQRIRTEVMSGKGADLFLLRTSYIWSDNLFQDVDKAMRSGVFCDLNSYLEQDQSFHIDDFFEPVIQAGSCNNKQYLVPLSFKMPMLISTEDSIASMNFDVAKAEANMDNFVAEIKNSLPEGQWPSISVIDFLGILDQHLLDYDNSKVLLDTLAVRNAIKWSRELDYVNVYDENINLSPQPDGDLDRATKLSAGTLKMFGCELFIGGSIPGHAQIMQKQGAKPVFLAVPNEKGGVTAIADSYAAIRANSSNKDAAYGLISYLLGKECQESKAYPGVSFPVRKDSLRNAVELGRLEYWSTSDFADKNSVALNDENYEAFYNAVNRMTTAHLQIILLSGEMDYGDVLDGPVDSNAAINEAIRNSTEDLQRYLEE
ncbi:MAG: ABC transporter substrate-binding protein [Syntrophomonadaceae bacterium]|nr:ABC transporter substrate-binding protein [Syntrophomonadaceae bacterium]